MGRTLSLARLAPSPQGVITVKGLVDREKGDFYTLTVAADEGGPKADSTVVSGSPGESPTGIAHCPKTPQSLRLHQPPHARAGPQMGEAFDRCGQSCHTSPGGPETTDREPEGGVRCGGRWRVLGVLQTANCSHPCLFSPVASRRPCLQKVSGLWTGAPPCVLAVAVAGSVPM